MLSYCVITPARNEQEHIEHTIRSMAVQTLRPARWVIVDDGSTDATPAIIDRAARDYPWILALHRPDRGFRKQGGGVIEAFNEGYQRVAAQPWDYLVKFDADLSFDTEYFARCLEKFAEDPKLGIGGGMICQENAGRLECESPGDPAFHVRGATKIYRRACWDAIGGLMLAPGWDTVDELKANMLGWTTRTFPDVPLRHHRFTGTADGTWKNQVKFGMANYIAGYHPLFMLAKCIKRIPRRPCIVGAAALAWGYLMSALRGADRVGDPRLIRYVRRQQINCLLLKPSLWRDDG